MFVCKTEANKHNSASGVVTAAVALDQRIYNIVGLNTSCILIISDNIVILNFEGQDITHAPKGCG